MENSFSPAKSVPKALYFTSAKIPKHVAPPVQVFDEKESYSESPFIFPVAVEYTFYTSVYDVSGYESPSVLKPSNKAPPVC